MPSDTELEDYDCPVNTRMQPGTKFALGLLCGCVAIGSIILIIIVARRSSDMEVPQMAQRISQPSRATSDTGRQREHAISRDELDVAEPPILEKDRHDNAMEKRRSPVDPPSRGAPSPAPLTAFPRRSQQDVASEWSHQELIDQLTAKGLRFESTASSRGGRAGPCMYFIKKGNTRRKYTLDDPACPFCHPQFWFDVAIVQKRISPQNAKDLPAVLRGRWNEQRKEPGRTAGDVLLQLKEGGESIQREQAGLPPLPPKPIMPLTEIQGESAFSWHKFLFAGDPSFLREIRSALP